MSHRAHRSAERGQTLVIFAAGVAGLLALLGLVVDGSNAYAQHRWAQNAADAASQAGATVLARALLEGLDPVDVDVKDAINDIAADNGVNPFDPGTPGSSEAYYTDINGDMLSPSARVGSGMPSCSANCIDGHPVGVRAVTVRPFQTYLSGIIGLTEFAARSEAIARAGYIREPCEAEAGCPLLPVTVSLQQGACDPTAGPTYDGVPWVVAAPPYTSINEVMIPLCEPGTSEWPGAADWLDFGCGSLKNQIQNSCNGPITFPTWLPAWAGGLTGVGSAMDAYTGPAIGTYDPGLDKVVLVSIFDGVCRKDPGDGEPLEGPFPGVCKSGPGSGSVHYRVPRFAAFILDAYLDGSATSGCTTGAIRTFTTGPVKACLKGWFANAVLPPGPVGAMPFEDGTPRPLAVELIK